MTAIRTPIGRDTAALGSTDQERLGRTAPIRVLGLDLSLTATGFARGDRSGVLHPPKSVGLGVERLDWILREVLELAQGIELVAIEGYSFGSHASQSRAIGELGGLIRWGLWRKKVPYVDIPPSNVKKYAAGKGNAGKPEMLAAAIRRLDLDTTDDNVIDATWLRLMALDHYGFRIVEMPAAHRGALDKLKWPRLGGRR